MRLRDILLVALALIGSSANAQSWPTKPVRFIVPYAAGGATDIHARVVAAALSEQLGQNFLVENRSGAGGNIGTDAVAKSPADGYTFLVGGVGTHAINPHLYKKLPYNTQKDFEPIALIGSQPNVLAVHPSVAASNPQELIKLLKQKPGSFSYASPGQGTSNHLAMEMFKSRSGTFVVHIPYRGGAPAMQDVISGQVPMVFINLDVALTHIKAGKLKPIALSSPARSPLVPDVPTLAESGLAGFAATSWTAIYGPSGSPKVVVDRLNLEVRKALARPDIHAKLSAGGFTPSTELGPKEFSGWNKAEFERWGKAVRDSGATAE